MSDDPFHYGMCIERISYTYGYRHVAHKTKTRRSYEPQAYRHVAHKANSCKSNIHLSERAHFSFVNRGYDKNRLNWISLGSESLARSEHEHNKCYVTA